jgi:hypothetical protein
MLSVPAYRVEHGLDFLVCGKVAGKRDQQGASLVKPTFTLGLFRQGDSGSQASRPFNVRTLSVLSLAELVLWALAKHAREMWATGQLVSGTNPLGEQLGAHQFGSTGARCVARRVGTGLLGKGFAHEQLGGGVDAARLSQSALGFETLGGERLVLCQLDRRLLTMARASWRAIVSSPEPTSASREIKVARSGGAGVGVRASSIDIDSVAIASLSIVPALGKSESLGPGGRLSRSRTSASCPKLLRVIVPLLPLLLEEGIVADSRNGNGHDPSENRCRVMARRITMPIGWTVGAVLPNGLRPGLTSFGRRCGRGDWA